MCSECRGGRYVVCCLVLLMFSVSVYMFCFCTAEKCSNGDAVDVIFILDSSGSVGDNFGKVIEFCRRVVLGLSGEKRVGTVRYNNRAAVEFGLEAGSNVTFVLSAFEKLSKIRGSGCTNTTGALLVAAWELLGVNSSRNAEDCHRSSHCCTTWSNWQSSQNSGGSGRRRRRSSSSSSWRSSQRRRSSSGSSSGSLSIENGVWVGGRRVVILVSDGESNLGGDPSFMARDLRGLGIEMFAIGIGSSLSRAELESIASSPKDQHVFQTTNFEGLVSVVRKLEDGVCGCKL